jgi:effector-binding domain-containing protein
VKILLIVVVLIVACVAGAVIWMGMPQGPSLKDVAHLRTPSIVEMGPQKVLLVRAKGNPNEAGKQAFGLLMKTYYQLEGVPKGGPDFKPPRARWPVGIEEDMDQWVGMYAMPLPETVTELPEGASADGLTVELVNWEYGEVAQILHVGPYDQEMENVQTLMDFIEAEGYEVSGLHEEEYLRGPGFLFAGNPDNYLTLIRYPVRKVVG